MRMTPIPVPHRWLAALLGAALLIDVALSGSVGEARSFTPLIGAFALCVCAYVALTRTATGALAGAVVLVGSTFVIQATDATPLSIGIHGIVLSELLAGATLVVLAVWRCSVPVSIACVAALVVAGLFATLARGNPCRGTFCTMPYELVSGKDMFESLVFGLCLLLLSIGIGAYLRRVGHQRVESAGDALIRRQWPLGAALILLLLIESTEVGYDGLPTLVGAAGIAVCAFFAPKAPLRYALLGATAIVVVPLALRAVSMDPGYQMPLSFTGIGASMAMIAYAVRLLAPHRSAGAVAALVAGNLLSLWVRSRHDAFESNGMFLLGILLIISITTGWYFRGRDRERNQTVRAAVTSAQQGERMALARELHDVVAHHVTGIVVQAQAALLVADRSPEVTIPALERIERSGTEALTAMRTLVGSLRDGTAAWTAGSADATDQATTNLEADLHAIIENFPGAPVKLDLSLPDQLPHEVGRSVLRLVQESLTNVGKHAPNASTVRVTVATDEEGLHIRINDDGSKRPANPAGGSGGYGLVGMRERVELLGGRFEAGPSGSVGWSVEAWLPLRKEEP